MSGQISVARFREAYRRAVSDVMRFVTPERQEVIARHNLGLHPSRTNLTVYLEASEKRYVRAIELFNGHLTAESSYRALDVGGFLGAFPLALVRLGVPVTLAEVYAYYQGAFDDLATYLDREGVRIWDIDFTTSFENDRIQPFTMVTNMAMLEHLAGSPRQLMRNLRAVTDARGALVIDTPNLAYWPNRLTLLRGRSVYPALDDVYESALPFLGHHREYTAPELTRLLRLSGFEPRIVDCFNYSLSLRNGSWSDRVSTLLVYAWPMLLFRNLREVIIVLAVPEGERPLSE